ncbi:MAG: AI-2E family transporter [Actinomycetes bacterium]
MTAPAREPVRERVPQALVDAGAWAWRILVIALVIYGFARLAKKLELVVIPLLIAILLTALLHPVKTRLRRAGLGRGWAALATMIFALVVLGGIGAFVANRAAAGYPQLVDEVSHLITKTQDWLVTGPLNLQRSQVNDFGDKIVSFLKDRQGTLASSAITATKTAAEVLASALLTLFLTIFMVYDGDRIWAWIVGFFPNRMRARMHEAGEEVWRTISGYITGTFAVATFHGVVMGITLWIVGVPLVAPLAVLVFLGSFIPIIGVVIFGGLAVLVTLVAKGVTAAIVVLVVLVVEHQIEGHVLQPLVVGRYVRLHPMAIALTLAAGALIAGIPGAIFGVPIVASINAAAKILKRPMLDTGGTTPPPAAPEIIQPP